MLLHIKIYKRCIIMYHLLNSFSLTDILRSIIYGAVAFRAGVLSVLEAPCP